MLRYYATRPYRQREECKADCDSSKWDGRPPRENMVDSEEGVVGSVEDGVYDCIFLTGRGMERAYGSRGETGHKWLGLSSMLEL